MRYKIIIQPQATEDIDNAYNWYEEQQDGLGDLLLEELTGYYEKLEHNPEIFSWANKHHRQAILQRFPYVVIYEVINSTVYIDAVFHTSRNPRNKFKTR